jgi:dipeptidyl aminopeptidase/acylaminoacyl peptidase
VQNSDQLYIALKRLGVETSLVVYPDQHHWVGLPSMEADIYQRWLGWFDGHTS